MKENNEIAIVDEEKHEILLFNDQFDYLRSIKSIDGLKICHPKKIFCYNQSVYLVQRNNHQLFQLDLNFSKIKRLIRKSGEIYDTNNYPLDVFINSDNIYVLILRGLHTYLQVFDHNGEFNYEIKLQKKINSNRPLNDTIKEENTRILNFKVKNHTIFAMSKSKLFIFDSDGALKHIIHVNNLNSFGFMNNLLITHSEDGHVRSYEARDNLFEKYSYKLLMDVFISSVKSKSSFFENVNEKLMVFLLDENSLAFVDIQ